MRKLVCEGTTGDLGTDPDLWLQWPDRLDELPIVWVVHGHPDQVGGTVTIPVQAGPAEVAGGRPVGVLTQGEKI